MNELSESAKNSKEFFDVDSHFESMQNNPQYREIQEKYVFEKGKKLFLEVEVIDSEMSNYLYKWIYGNNGKNTPFGCKLNCISWIDPKEELKKKLLEFIETH